MKKNVLKSTFLFILSATMIFSALACNAPADGPCQQHTYGDWKLEKEPTCEEDGVRYAECTKCGEKKTEAVVTSGHDLDRNNKCSVCGAAFSVGLLFESNGDGTCKVSSIDTCTDTNIIIPPKSNKGDIVTGIGAKAFYKCTDITGITLPNTVTAIGDEAFRGCNSLANIVIPGSVTDLGAMVFYECSGLESVIIEEGLPYISNYMFSKCYSLSEISIPSSVVSIGESAFTACISLESITLPKGLSEIHMHAFMSSDLKSIVIPEGVTLIDIQAFSNCTQLTSVTIPGSVKSIGDLAFEYCQSLESVTLGDGTERIGSRAFSSCLALSSLNIPKSLSYIGKYAFMHSSLQSVTLENTTGWKVNGETTDVTSPTKNADILTSLYTSQMEWVRE